MRTVWKFSTARFTIRLAIEEDYGYQYDGDDEDGETQAKLNSGDYVAFDSRVTVELNGHVIGEDTLGGSVYDVDNMADFWTGHRDANPMNRNCTIMRAAHGGRAAIGHYFPDMVANAIAGARQTLAGANLRKVA